MGRKSNAQKMFEMIVILAIIVIAIVAYVFTKIVDAIKNGGNGMLYFLLVLGISAIVFVVIKVRINIQKQKEEKEKNDLMIQKFNLEVQNLIKEIYTLNETELKEIEQTNINLPKEKIFFQHPFKWQNVGGKKEYKGTLYITDSKIRYIDTAAHQLKFEKIMSFTHDKTNFTLLPDNDKSVIFLPDNCEYGYEQMLVVAKAFAILQLAQGKKLQDFAKTFCEILSLKDLKINGEVFYQEEN